MAKLVLCLILIFSLHHMFCKAQPPISTSTPTSTDFIKASCRATRYPALCIRCLSNYSTKIQQNERQLAQAAVSVSLARAQIASVFVTRLAKNATTLKPREYQAVRDCVVNMGETVYQLSRSVEELGSMGGRAARDFTWSMSNLQTWVSAALTNENTCLDGFSSGPTTMNWNVNVRTSITGRVMSVAQVTSNALALVNRFAARHKAGLTTGAP